MNAVSQAAAGGRSTAGSRTQKALRVTVLAGGPSAERDVSLMSGTAIAEGLRRAGHVVTVADINPSELAALDIPADVIFPALHGTFGEDGQVQRLMEARGLRFVGSGSRASATAMDKVATKALAIELGIPTPAFEIVEPGKRGAMHAPVVVKPIDQGSSVATTVVRSDAELPAALEAVHATFGRALVEKFIDGDELTVGILGRQALAPICIRPKRGFYDYEAKYHDDATEYLFDAGLPRDVLERVSRESVRLFDGLGCRHLGRVDWMIDRQAGVWLLEVNTLPGFTSHSLVPKAAAHAGLTFEALVDRLVRMALEDTA
jgi:D-alanine-D-alanine ligase